uniref:Eukaryotic peptide chain release factor GTP-binding subunit n=1 Tax=Blastobotrys adeninivorans TaxID=409370 RepID=A0A060T886_BLAAD
MCKDFYTSTTTMSDDQFSQDFQRRANINDNGQQGQQGQRQPDFSRYNFQPGGSFTPQGGYSQYGQYGQYGQQYGQYGQYNQYNQYGQYDQYNQYNQYNQYGGGYNRNYQQQQQDDSKTMTLEEYQNQQRSASVTPKAVAGKTLVIGGSKKPAEIKIGGAAKKPAEIKIGGSKETKAEPKTESKPEAKSEPKVEAKTEQPKVEAKEPEATSTANTEAKAEPKSASATPTPTPKGNNNKSRSETPTVEGTKQSAEELIKEQEKLDQEIVADMFGGADVKEHMSIIFMGHVDAGKSTMGGNILYLTGAVDKRTVEKYEKDAKDAGRQGWYLSWIMDTNREERDQGKTVEVGRSFFETEKRRYTILDAPGHKMYVPNMIGGASQADVGVLVISARKGEYETGFEKGGQTREHAVLAKTQGVNKLVVVVNKMDDPTVQWSKERYDECTSKLSVFLKGTGYSKDDVVYMPVSGFTGAGLKDRVNKKECPWYDGPSLLEYLDSVKLMDRKIGAPFMLPVSLKGKDLGTIVEGKIESGAVKKGDQLMLMPNKANVEISAVFNESEAEVSGALSGEQVRLRLKGVEEEDVQIGFVLTSPKNPVHTVTKFEAQLAIVELKAIMTAGYTCVMHVHTAIEEVALTELLHKLEKGTNRKSKKPPAFAKRGMKVIAVFETANPVCIEPFSKYPQLGRFTLRDQGQTVAIGKVTKILG